MGRNARIHRIVRGPAIAVVLALAVTALGACTRDVSGLPRPRVDGMARLAGLERPSDCAALADAAREQLLARLDAPVGGPMMEADATAGPVTTAAAPAGDATSGAGTVVAGTNNQEGAVDEADLVKTDGSRIVTVVDGVLRTVGLDGTPAVDGTLDLRAAGARQLFLRGDEAVVIGSALPTARPEGAPGTTKPTDALPAPVAQPATTITRVALDGPNGPTVVESTSVDGDLAAARMIDGTIRLVLRSTPMAVARAWSGSGAGDVRATDLRAAVARLTGEDLLPHRTTADGRVVPLGTCADVLAPTGPTGPTGIASSDPTVPVTPPDPTQDVTVLTVGPTLGDLAPVTVTGGVDTIYASPDALYLAANSWNATGATTTVHRLDLTGAGAARYTGSGTVPGSLVDRYALSERRGDLGLVTTAQDPAGRTAGRLVVLRSGPGGALAEVGHVDDLGVGESVQSVRFLDDRAYVVTFRRTDPLFALDLSDPTAPRVLGQVKVPGFSEYLHPVGDGRLLGIGRDVDPATGADRGLKASLFDVSDPTAPRELSTIVRPADWSSVADDPLAFTWDPVRNQAVVPVSSGPTALSDGACPPGADCAVAEPVPALPPVPPPPPIPSAGPGALVIGVTGDALVLRGELSHPAAADGRSPQILRSVVVDGDLWTVSAVGLGRTAAAAPTGVELLAF